MAEACKRATKAADQMHIEWLATKKSNEELSAWLQQIEEKLREAKEHIQTCDFLGIPHVLDKKLWDQLQAKEKEAQHTNRQAKEVEAKVKKMENRMQLAKTKLGAFLDAKDKRIHALKQQLQQQMVEKKEETEKVDELEVYIQMQEEHYSDQIAQLVLEKSEIMHTKYEQHK